MGSKLKYWTKANLREPLQDIDSSISRSYNECTLFKTVKWSKEIQQIINARNENGGPFWSRADGDIHAPNGSSTIDTIGVLGELGVTLPEYRALSKIPDFVFNYQTQEGGFKYSRTSGKFPCITGRVLAALGRIGSHKDKRTEAAYRHLLDIQWSDGGWRCKTAKLGKSPVTDASNPGTTLYVLDAFRFRSNSLATMNCLDSAVGFLLDHWDVKKPLGPCEFGMGSRFFQIEYPFLRYNLFYYVYVLSFYKSALKDTRFKAAFETLTKKVKDEKIKPENPHRAWRKFAFAQKGMPSEKATERWLEIRRNIRSL